MKYTNGEPCILCKKPTYGQRIDSRIICPTCLQDTECLKENSDKLQMSIYQNDTLLNFWGDDPLPDGAKTIGLISWKSLTDDYQGSTGTLIQLANGEYVQGNMGYIRALNQKAVKKILTQNIYLRRGI